MCYNKFKKLKLNFKNCLDRMDLVCRRDRGALITTAALSPVDE